MRARGKTCLAAGGFGVSNGAEGWRRQLDKPRGITLKKIDFLIALS
jgi:hypothetical protein